MFINNFIILFSMFLFTQPFVIDSLRTIALKSGGIKGFYMFGICKYLKDSKKDLIKDSILYGASAGAWNALYLSMNTDDSLFIKKLKSIDLLENSHKSLLDLETTIQDIFINNYSTTDFNLDRINICTCIVKPYKIEKKIFSGFKTLDETIECCMASSHIPYITTWKATHAYNGYSCIDGGVFMEPHHKDIKPELTISYDMFENKDIDQYELNNLRISDMIDMGYNDAHFCLKL